MSTSAIVEFKGNGDRVQIYVHSDGYPEGMIPLLKEFLKWNHARNDDVSYTAANFIYWYKKEALKRTRQYTHIGSSEWGHSKTSRRGFVLQVEQTGVAILPLMNKKEMHRNYIDYFYEVRIHESAAPEIKEVIT